MNLSIDNNLTWAEFTKVEMRVGTIVWAEQFDKARKPAYFIGIDFGALGIRKTSAQITTLYNCEELIGLQVIAVTNFPPKQIANLMSECLLLGAVFDSSNVVLIKPERAVPNGTKIA